MTMENDPMKELCDTIMRQRARHIVNELLGPNPFAKWAPPPRPLTRCEKVARWFGVRWERVKLAARVLRGDDIHEHCD